MGVDLVEGAGARPVAACPWCGAGTALAPVGDGVGNVMLTCTTCGCKGPPMPIGTDFAAADVAALARWSLRQSAAMAGLSEALLDRLRRSLALHTLLHGVRAGEAPVSLPLADLLHLLRAADVRLG